MDTSREIDHITHPSTTWGWVTRRLMFNICHLLAFEQFVVLYREGPGPDYSNAATFHSFPTAEWA